VLGQKKAVEAGAKEALMVTQEGEVLEGATSNGFWLVENTLWTVPVAAGILAGITRAHILTVARDLGWEVAERVPLVSELLHSEAVFISSSIRELVSVVRIDGEQVGAGRVSPRVLALHAAFRARARTHLVA
jgi:branched-subunit amino acid aminotransferase/4-amino-4-deoxychorismate lyase